MNKHSKLYGVPIENYYYISVCMKLGSCYVDTKGERCNDPFWTITDVNDKNNKSMSASSGGKNTKFRIFKNGIHFNFTKGSSSDMSPSFLGALGSLAANGSVIGNSAANGSQPAGVDSKIYLDSVVYKV